MMRIATKVMMGVLVSIAAVGCGGDDEGSNSAGESSADGGSSAGGDLSTSELVELLVTSGAPEDEAKCVAENLEGSYTDEEMQAFFEVTSEEDLVDAELAVDLGNALATCNLG